MNTKQVNASQGQAMVEYLLLFGLMAFIIIGLVRGFSEAMGRTVGSLGYVLSTKLSSGVCVTKEICFIEKYKN